MSAGIALAALAVFNAGAVIVLSVCLLQARRRWNAHRCTVRAAVEMRVFVDGCDQPVFQASSEALHHILHMDGLDKHTAQCTSPCQHWSEFMQARAGALLHYEFRRIP